MDAQQTVLNRPMGGVFWGLVRTPPEQRDLKAVEVAIGEAARAWRMIALWLEQAGFHRRAELHVVRHPVGGARASLVRHRLPGLTRPEISGLRAWYDRLCRGRHIKGMSWRRRSFEASCIRKATGCSFPQATDFRAPAARLALPAAVDAAAYRVVLLRSRSGCTLDRGAGGAAVAVQLDWRGAGGARAVHVRQPGDQSVLSSAAYTSRLGLPEMAGARVRCAWRMLHAGYAGALGGGSSAAPRAV